MAANENKEFSASELAHTRSLAVKNSVILRFGGLVATGVFHGGRWGLMPLNKKGLSC